MPIKHLRYDSEPTEKQREALQAEGFAVLYGGALGGGKTEWLLQCVSLYSERYPGCRMGFARRNFKELMQSGGPLDRAEQLWQHQAGVKYNKAEKRFIAANGTRVEFRHCEKKGDEEHFQGSEYDVVLIDEASLFRPEMLSYFVERIRGKHASLYRLSSNPGGPSHQWLNENFRKKPLPGFSFIPATAADNPHLPDGYYDRLEYTMTGLDKRQRLYGDWDAINDTNFFLLPAAYTGELPQFVAIARAWDLGAGGDNTVGTLVARSINPLWHPGCDPAIRRNHYWVLDQIVEKTPAHTITSLITDTHKAEPGVTVLIEQEPGASARAYVASLEFAQPVPADKNKRARAKVTANLFGRGQVEVLREHWAQALFDEMSQFGGDDNGGADDRVDSMVHGINWLAKNEVMFWGF